MLGEKRRGFPVALGLQVGERLLELRRTVAMQDPPFELQASRLRDVEGNVAAAPDVGVELFKVGQCALILGAVVAFLEDDSRVGRAIGTGGCTPERKTILLAQQTVELDEEAKVQHRMGAADGEVGDDPPVSSAVPRSGIRRIISSSSRRPGRLFLRSAPE